jgi:hypothetical protein
VPGLGVLLHVHKDILDVTDVLVGLVAAVHELHVFNAVRCEVLVELGAVDGLHLIIDNGNAPAKRLVYIIKESVCRAEDAARDLDGRRETRAHDRLNRGRVPRGEREGVALPVDGRGIHRVGVGHLQVVSVLAVLCPDIVGQGVDHVLDFLLLVQRCSQSGLKAREGSGHLFAAGLLGHLLEQDGEVTFWQVPKIFQLL